MPLDIRPMASPEMVQGYEYTADLADARHSKAIELGAGSEARVWLRVSEYCRDMATSRATDDDQFKFQRDQMRHRCEIPMSQEEMDMKGLFTVAGAATRRLPGWKQEVFEEIIELALGYLSPMQRVVFELVTGGMLTVAEVAEAVRSDPREIRQHLGRARRKMKTDVAPRVGRLLVLLQRKVG